MAKKRTSNRARVFVKQLRNGRWDWHGKVSLAGGPYATYVENKPTYAERKDAKRSAERTMDKLGIEIAEMNVE